MRFSWLAVALALAALSAGCGDDNKLPRSNVGGSTGSGGKGGTSATGGAAGSSAGGAAGSSAGGTAGVGGSGATGGGGTGGSGGSITIPDTACTDAKVTGSSVYGPKAIDGLDQLEPAGSRWAAAGAIGFVTFDATGQNASATPTLVGLYDRIAGSSTDLLVVQVTDTGVEYGFYDPQGAPSGGATPLFSGNAFNLAVGRSGPNALAVWSSSAGVKARALTSSGPDATTTDLEPGAKTDSLSASITPAANDEFAIAWSDRRQSDGEYRTFFAFAKNSGLSGLVHLLSSGSTKQVVSQLVATQKGFALLQDIDGVPTLTLIDQNGLASGPAHVLDGAMQAHGIASQGDRLVLVARRTDHRDAIRTLDLDGAAVAPWICLTAAAPGGLHAASIHTDGAGYAVLYRAPDESEKIAHVSDPTNGS